MRAVSFRLPRPKTRTVPLPVPVYKFWTVQWSAHVLHGGLGFPLAALLGIFFCQKFALLSNHFKP